jgi:hypothetical protein
MVYAVYGLGLLLVPEAIPDRHQHAPIIDMAGRKYLFKSWRWKKLATSKESLEDESQICIWMLICPLTCDALLPSMKQRH